MSIQYINTLNSYSQATGKVDYTPTTPLKVSELIRADEKAVITFLSKRPVHTVVMASFIRDHGLISPCNRGKFYGYRDSQGKLEGVALIGHTTLIEARSERALAAFARQARNSEIPIKLVMSAGNIVEDFWNHFVENNRPPRLLHTELLFEIKFPAPLQQNIQDLRPATNDDLLLVAEAHGTVAFEESGINPFESDRERFLERVLLRIEKRRCWVVVNKGKLLFKADIAAETPETIYLEGIYVAPEARGKNIAPHCLAHLSRVFLQKVESVCLLSNEKSDNAHRAYRKAGFEMTDCCQTIFV